MSSRTGGRIVVNRSSGGTGGRGVAPGVCRGPPRCPPEERADPPAPAAPFGVSVADRSCCPSLFTGRAGVVARRTRAARTPWRAGWSSRAGRAGRAEQIRLDQMIPTAGPAHLHDVYRELRETGCQQDQLFGGTRRTGYRAQMVAEYPRHQRELLFPANRAHHWAELPVKFRRAQQVGIGVTHLGYAGSPRINLGQQ